MSIDKFDINCWPKIRSITPVDQPPHPRSGHRAIATTTDFYIWGGYCPLSDVLLAGDRTDSENPVIFPELWRYNFSQNSWSLCIYTGDAPNITVASSSVCISRDKLFVYGGTGFPFGENVSNDLHVCGLHNLQWEKLDITGDVLPKSYGSSLVVIGNYIYMLFGTNGFTFHSQVHRVDLKNNVCEKLSHSLDEKNLSDYDGGRYRQEIAVFDDKIYVLGGGGPSGVCYDLDEIPIFDTISKSWTWLKTKADKKFGYPCPRKFHSAVVSERDVYIFGGVFVNLDFSDDEEELAVDKYIWKYNVDSNQWKRTRSKLPWKSYFHAAAITPTGQLIYQGGVIAGARSTRRTSIMYTVWLRPPKLFDYLVFMIGQHSYCLNASTQLQQSSTEKNSYALMLAIPKHISIRVQPSDGDECNTDNSDDSMSNKRRIA